MTENQVQLNIIHRANFFPDLFRLEHSLSQMKGMLIPLLTTHLTGIPIPRIEGSKDGYQFAIENFIFSASDILPEYIHLRASSDIKVTVPSLHTEKAVTKITLKM
jgi:hypothetical protein